MCQKTKNNIFFWKFWKIRYIIAKKPSKNNKNSDFWPFWPIFGQKTHFFWKNNVRIVIKIQFYVWKSVYLKFYRPKNSFWRQFLGQKHLKIVIFLSRRPVSVIFGIKTYLFLQNNTRIVIFSQFYVQKHIHSNLNVLKNDFERPKKLSKIA